MHFKEIFPCWNELTEKHKSKLEAAVFKRQIKKGEIISGGEEKCSGLILVKSGQLRAYILSSEGREVTLYRLFERDICLFSASCVLNSLTSDIFVEAKSDSDVFVIPPEVFKEIMSESAACANYTNKVMAARFSEVTWLIEQVMWKSMDKRVSEFLLEESAIENSDDLSLTHEDIANHIGTHREVVTRMLKYLAGEGAVKLKRGKVLIEDRKALAKLAE